MPMTRALSYSFVLPAVLMEIARGAPVLPHLLCAAREDTLRRACSRLGVIMWGVGQGE